MSEKPGKLPLTSPEPAPDAHVEVQMEHLKNTMSPDTFTLLAGLQIAIDRRRFLEGIDALNALLRKEYESKPVLVTREETGQRFTSGFLNFGIDRKIFWSREANGMPVFTARTQ